MLQIARSEPVIYKTFGEGAQPEPKNFVAAILETGHSSEVEFPLSTEGCSLDPSKNLITHIVKNLKELSSLIRHFGTLARLSCLGLHFYRTYRLANGSL
ncbi:MAG: hypothetical protein WA021_01475 [Minisyncoccia bacterium]